MRTDRQLLAISMDLVIRNTNNMYANLKGEVKYLFKDGIDAPIDMDIMPPVLLEIAEAAGYKIVDGMIEERGNN